jgi:sulfotransferase family protein
MAGGPTMPSFLVVGAAKAGTTALYQWLRQHPDVYVTPTKETNFFALESQRADFAGPGDDVAINRFSLTNLDDYRRQFDGVGPERAVGEVCPLYLYSPRAAERIRHHVPDAKLVAILRDPIERAYSNFLHQRRDGREPLAGFADALAAEPERIAANWEWFWHYRQVGLYGEQLARFEGELRDGRMRVYLHDDLEQDPASLLRDLLGFLGVDDSFVPTAFTRVNRSAPPRSAALHEHLVRQTRARRLARRLLPRRARRRVRRRLLELNLDDARRTIAPEVRQTLADFYREDVARLQNLIGRDLSDWLRGAGTARR